MKIYILILLIPFFNSINSFSQSLDSTQRESFLLIIDDLGVEELLNMKASIPSKKAERVSDAPGMITIYNSNDIERYGYYTLKDLANITSGYSTFSAYGETNLETRGQKAGSWNVSKHLLLVDGIPVNHSRANSAPLEYNIPLFFADKVEFLKGPGSALYGTSAFLGVMSITPKSLKENGVLAEAKLSYGDIGNSKRIMANAITKKELGQTNLSISYFKKSFSGDSIGLPKKTKLFDDDNSFFLNSSFKFNDNTNLKGLGIGVIYTRRNSHGGEFWGATPSPLNEITWEEFIPYVKFKRELSDKFHVNSYLKYNNSTEQSVYNSSWNTFRKQSTVVDAYNYSTANIEALGELTVNLNKNASLISGVNYDTRKETPSPSSFGYDAVSPDTSIKGYNYNYKTYPGSLRVNVLSAYTQFQNKFNILKGLNFTAGLRLDYGYNQELKYSQLSPRIGLVQKIIDELSLKALYGKALRVPGIKELALNKETKAKVLERGGDPSNISNIVPETIESFELGMNINASIVSFSISSFINSTINSLDGIQYSYTDKFGEIQNPNYFRNTNGKTISKGLELDGQIAINQNIRFMVNHSIANTVINDTLQYSDVPTQKTNASATYVIPGRIRLSTTAVFRMVHGFKTNQQLYGTSVINGYNLFDLNFILPLSPNINFELQIRNILDTQWGQPSLLASPTSYWRTNLLPIARRGFMVTLAMKI